MAATLPPAAPETPAAPGTPPPATRDEVTALRRRVKDLEKTVQRLAGQLENMLELRMRVAQIESREEQLRSRLQTAVIRLPTSFGDVNTGPLEELDSDEAGLTTADEDEPGPSLPEPSGGVRTNLFAQLLAEAGVSGAKPPA
jgi:hypothetical protein